MTRIERRLLLFGLGLVAAGTLVAGGFFGLRAGASLVVGGVVGGGSMFWLRATVHSLLLGDAKASKMRALAGFFARLLLIPLILYVMIRSLFLNIPAAVAGFALFNCCVLVEGVFEAFSRSSR